VTKHPIRNNQDVRHPPFLVEKVMILTTPVVSFLYVLPGWTAKVVNADRGIVISLSRRASDANSQYIQVHDARAAFEAIETIEDATRFFEKHGPLDQNRDYSLSQIKNVQEKLRKTRQMDHQEFFGPKQDFRHWYDASPLQGQLLVGQRPFWSLEALDVLTAIRYATFLDHMRQVKAGTCRRCGKLYELPPQKIQFYCTTKCQTAAGKDRWNQKQRNGKKTISAHPPKVKAVPSRSTRLHQATPLF
jgi:hypothetical protein